MDSWSDEYLTYLTVKHLTEKLSMKDLYDVMQYNIFQQYYVIIYIGELL